MKTLKDMKVGESARLVKVHGAGALKRRLMDMGLTRGAECKVVKVAPLGDPLEIHVCGYGLSLRREDASVIEVEG